jgi:hypothetical protein
LRADIRAKPQITEIISIVVNDPPMIAFPPRRHGAFCWMKLQDISHAGDAFRGNLLFCSPDPLLPLVPS